MGSFRLVTGNRLENLSAALAGVLKTPLSSPLTTEVIVVQSSGMARWISMEIARQTGICANIRFVYPNEFITELFSGLVTEGQGATMFDPEILTWRILKRMPGLAAHSGFGPLRRYVGDDGQGLKAFQLSSRIADLFDQYALYRPEMIFRWEKGEEDHWQAVLWRSLSQEARNLHRPALLKRFHEIVGAKAAPDDRLPSRVSVFGISALPRFHVEALTAVAQVADVYLFVMNPCSEYWGDLPGEREIRRGVAEISARGMDRDWFHLEPENRLLSGLGTVGRDFLELLQSGDLEQEEVFEDPGMDSLLHCIQSDILHLRGPSLDATAVKRRIDPDDRSVSLHACHSPMREVEVLRDHLLDWFEHDPGLEPGDILVMATDIERYAPYIQAVMDTPEEEGRRIPYSIADRNLQSESRVVRMFLSVLDLLNGRFGLGQVTAVLEFPPIRKRFGLSETDCERIQKWCTDTNIRWGLDGSQRAGLGLPDIMDNTWAHGLERMLLGYAMSGGDRQLFAGRLPYDSIEGEPSLALGKLAEFITVLTRAVRDFLVPAPLTQRSGELLEFLDRLFIADEDTETEIQSLRDHLLRLGEIQELAGFDRPVGLAVIREHLAERFQRKGFGFGFITGGVTFCAMVPMRSIPFKIICLLGMDNDAYPRESGRIGFDLMAQQPRRGDRSRRLDDQYMFLEALVSARDRLYVSYVGQSVRDNSLSPPSVLVSDLLDYIDGGFCLPDGGSPLPRLHTFQRLQPFSPAYFTASREPDGSTAGGGLFSYSTENRDAAVLLLSQRRSRPPFWTGEFPEAREEPGIVELDDLVRFFSHPARYFMQRALGIFYETDEPVPDEREPFDIVGLSRYSLDRSLLANALAGGTAAEIKGPVRASGALPHAVAGDCLFEKLAHEADWFARIVRDSTAKALLPPLDVFLEISGFRLIGSIGTIHADAMVRYRYARIKSIDQISAWIHHLVLNSLSPANYPRETVLVALQDESRSRSQVARRRFSPPAHCRETLLELLTAYGQGLSRPLPFFPRTSMAYMVSLRSRGRSPDEALEAARKSWEGGLHAPGEGNDPYYRRCFADRDILDREFAETAERLLGPVIDHMVETTGDEDI
ncbi:MAG: exodeoxyribonuclease V subunit gamma [Thermodesulfobacteriota bacterium]